MMEVITKNLKEAGFSTEALFFTKIGRIIASALRSIFAIIELTILKSFLGKQGPMSCKSATFTTCAVNSFWQFVWANASHHRTMRRGETCFALLPWLFSYFVKAWTTKLLNPKKWLKKHESSY
uniref:Uncharacterized protein n=1 Tax=Romanomermis culicivorax TaxID=13658 RepID=A0A915KM79_ROMCU